MSKTLTYKTERGCGGYMAELAVVSGMRDYVRVGFVLLMNSTVFKLN